MAVVFLAALGFRGAYLGGQAANNPLFDQATMDPGVHHEWAQQIASGEGMGSKPYFRAPLYYYLLAGLYKLCGPDIMVGRVAGCILGALTCYLIARLGVMLAGFGVGLLAGVIAAFYWPFVYFDAELLTVGLEVFLDVGLLILLLVAARRSSLPLFFLGGLVWGLSAITRPNVLALAPVIIVWPWIAARMGQRPLRRLAAGGLACLGAALVVAPVTIRNYVVGGELVLIATNGGVNFYIGNNPESDGYTAIVPGTRPDWWGGYVDTHRIPEQELGRKLTEGEVSRYWFSKASDWIRSEPLAWAGLMLHKFRLFWSSIEMPNNRPIWFFVRQAQVSVLFWVGFPVVGCLGVAGLALLLPQWRTWFLPLAFLVVYMATVVLFLCAGRYRLPIVAVLILTTAAGLLRLVGLLRRRRLWALAVYLVLGGLCAAALATTPSDRTAFRARSDGLAHHSVGLYYARPTAERPPDYAKAIAHLREAIRLRPTFGGARRALAVSLLNLQRVDEAGREFARARALAPHDTEVLFDYASFLGLSGKYREAAEQYQALVARQPWHAEGHHRLGAALARLGRNAEAVRHLRTALEIQPDLHQARRALGSILAKQGELDEAIGHFEQMLETEPTNAPVLCELGTALLKRGHLERALACFQTAARQDPDLAPASLGLANALRKTGRYGEAIGVLRGAARRAPRNAQLLNVLGWLLATAPDAQARDGAEALQVAQQALGVAGRARVRILDTLAAAYAELGRYDEAIEAAERALGQARKGGAVRLAEEIEGRLALYRQRRPYRQATED